MNKKGNFYEALNILKLGQLIIDKTEKEQKKVKKND